MSVSHVSHQKSYVYFSFPASQPAHSSGYGHALPVAPCCVATFCPGVMSRRGANTALVSCGLPHHLSSRPRRPSRCLLIGPAHRDETMERLETKTFLYRVSLLAELMCCVLWVGTWPTLLSGEPTVLCLHDRKLKNLSSPWLLRNCVAHEARLCVVWEGTF